MQDFVNAIAEMMEDEAMGTHKKYIHQGNPRYKYLKLTKKPSA